MPNWCSNKIIIYGNEDKINEIFSKMEKSEQIFKDLIGLDEDMTMEKYEKGGWYDHNTNRYGTKWDISANDSYIDKVENIITLECETAWSPPEAFCQTLSEMYGVNVEITYLEGAMDFAGKSEYSDGEEINSSEYCYHEGLYILDNEAFWEYINVHVEFFKDDEGMSFDEVCKIFPFMDEEDKLELKVIYDGDE